MEETKERSGDGLKFYNARLTSGVPIKEVVKTIPMGTLYRMFDESEFDKEQKELAAAALNKTVEEIFGADISQKTNNGEKISTSKGLESKEGGINLDSPDKKTGANTMTIELLGKELQEKNHQIGKKDEHIDRLLTIIEKMQAKGDEGESRQAKTGS